MNLKKGNSLSDEKLLINLYSRHLMSAHLINPELYRTLADVIEGQIKVDWSKNVKKV